MLAKKFILAGTNSLVVFKIAFFSNVLQDFPYNLGNSMYREA